MSKLSCTCGRVIADQAGSLPFKAHLLSDGDGERFQPYTPAPGSERGILRSARPPADAAEGTSPT